MEELKKEHMIKMDDNFEIKPCNNEVDVGKLNNYQRLELTPAQKIHMSAFIQQVPTLIAASTLAQSYILKFPEGITGTLMKYKNGGVGSPIIGEKNIVGHASFHKASMQGMLFGIFSVMSIATSQYYLSTINDELEMIKSNVDKILGFLYGDKKAELMSEVSFIRYAYQNYNSIMAHEQQRIATITSIQEAKKIAIKDIEFYIEDLNASVNSKNESNIEALVNNVSQTKESLELSMQLYALSSLLEVYYAQNQDINYIQYITEDSSAYLNKCEKRMLSNFSMLKMRIQTCKDKALKKLNKPALEKKMDEWMNLLNGGDESETCKFLRSSLSVMLQSTEYCIQNDGSVYLKTA